MYAQRIAALQQLQASNGLQSVALIPGANLRYFTGLTTHASERPYVVFLPVAGYPVALVPELEVPAAKTHLPKDVQVLSYRDEEGHEHLFYQVAEELGLAGKAIGVEFLSMRMLEMRRIEQAAPRCQFVATEPWMPSLRMCKDEAELSLMRRAVEIAQQAMSLLLEEGAIRAGRTELEVAADLRIAMLRGGGQGEAFAPIVVSGPNSAMPHAGPANRVLAKGDLVTIDWGTVYEGYCSDITRTFVLGTPTPEMTRMHEAVLTANEAGRLAARAGRPCQEVDRIARRAIAQAGFGEFFIHRTGHGLGLETHEPPYLVEGNLELLQIGMTITIEPGVYIPGLGGVRIEDDVVITERGAEVLTTLPRQLLSIG